MSFEFVGVHAPIHYQCFQMVDMLMHHFRWNMKKLNPSAKPYVPTTEVGEVNFKEAVQQQDEKIIEEKEHGWKFPSKHAHKRKMNDSETGMPVSGTNNNVHNMLEYDEEEEHDEMKECEDEDENNRKGDEVNDGKIKERFDLEDMSLDDVEEITCKWNELHPEDGLCGGLFKHVDEIRTKSEEKEKERCEMVNIQNCITLVNYVNVNEIKAQKHVNKHLIDEHNDLIEECNKKNLKDDEIREEELEQVKSFVEHKCKIEEENNRIIRELKRKIIRMNNAERNRETNRKARHK